MLRSLESALPRVHPSAFVHEAARVIGGVSIGALASIWPGAVLRGDVDRVFIGSRSNVQDNVVIHCRPGRPCRVGRGVTVGHGVILHGAEIGDGCLIGMGAVVMEARIGARSLVAAGSLVLAGMVIPPRSLVMGSPARILRPLKPKEIRGLAHGEREYIKLARRHHSSSRVVA